MEVREVFTLELGLKGWKGKVILEDKTAKKALVLGIVSTVTQLYTELGEKEKRIIEDGAEKKEMRDRFSKGSYIMIKINGARTKIFKQWGKLFIYL